MASYQQQYQSYQPPHYVGNQQKSNATWIKPPPPYAGAPPPVPAGMSVNPQQWQAGYWHYNPAWNQTQSSKQQPVQWIPSHQWMPQNSQQPTSSASQQQVSHNPYKRVPRPPSAEYLATQLSDNPLGLSGLDEPNKYYDQVHTPWVWRPRDLDEDDQQSPSQDQSSTDAQSFSRRNSDNTVTDEPEYFTAKRELQPTFSINIVRTPDHYRRQSSGSNPSTPSRNSSHESRNPSADAWTSPTSNGLHVGSRDLVGSSPDSSGSLAAGPILGDHLSEEPSSILSPLIMNHTPKPGSSPLRGLRLHATHPLIGSNLEPIPEAQSDSKPPSNKQKARHHVPVTHASSLPTMTNSQNHSGPNNMAAHWDGHEKERDRREKEKKDRSGIGSKYTTFIEPRSIVSHAYDHITNSSSPASHSSNSTPSSRPSASSLPSPPYSSSHASPPSSYSPRPSPPQRKSKHSPPEEVQFRPQLHGHSPASSFTKNNKPSDSNTLVKIPLPLPPSLQGAYAPIRRPSFQTYDNRRRKGYWNRRGDHLTGAGYVVLAPSDRLFPPELRNYPAEDEGYENHDGTFTAFIPRPELPESIPRMGKPAEQPYENFVVYESQRSHI